MGTKENVRVVCFGNILFCQRHFKMAVIKLAIKLGPLVSGKKESKTGKVSIFHARCLLAAILLFCTCLNFIVLRFEVRLHMVS